MNCSTPSLSRRMGDTWLCLWLWRTVALSVCWISTPAGRLLIRWRWVTADGHSRSRPGRPAAGGRQWRHRRKRQQGRFACGN